MYQEQDYVRQIREVNARANKAAERLFWDSEQKRIRPMSYSDPDRPGLEVTKPDLGHSALDGQDNTVITIFEDTIRECGTEGSLDLQFHRWDNGDAYTQVNAEENARYTVPGILLIDRDNGPVDVSKVCTDEVQICVVARWQQDSADQSADEIDAKGEWKTKGFVRQDGSWKEVPVQAIPIRADLFKRTKGLYESKVLSDAWVLTAGPGSVGSFVTELLAMSGIMNQIIIDYERVELANVIRQNASICDCGRYKTKVAAQKIYNKNIYANTESHELRITWQNQEFVRGLVRRSDIVIGAVDNREPRSVLNRLCVEEDKPLILMGAFHRAFGVQILFMRRPRIDPCYMCYLMSRPPEEKNRWTSNLDRGRQVAYADYHVPEPEPALCVDIAPMNIMTVKLCINELLKDKPTTMRSLDQDLIAQRYIYLNRREGPYEGLKPLGFNVGDSPHILSWWGIELERNPACPVCGDYVGEMSRAHGISMSSKEEKKHEQKTAK